ncbi:MAG TPA: hypothetical protein VG267_17050 [Terracidiphilus sp.]|jgi:hypothetical protein|nr:hypothetical protein [Terracidiphilus sp.]
MPCKIDVDTAVKRDILDCDPAARVEIGDFLLALQENPLPRERQPLGENAYYVLLSRGFYVSWEVIGDVLHFVLTGDSGGLIVRILGVAR